MKTSKLRKGFTLIELLIVITIIGILAVAFLPRIVSIPSKARDSARQQNLQTIAAAIEVYTLEKGKLPTFTSGKRCLAEGDSELSGYMEGGKLPTDPSGLTVKSASCSAGQYVMYSLANHSGAAYALVAQVENNEAGNEGDLPKDAASAGGTGSNLGSDDSGIYYVLVK